MTKSKKVLCGVFVAYLFMALSFAHAQNDLERDRGPQKGRFEQRVQEIYNQLKLTDDQKKQLEANKQQHRARMQTARQEMKANKEAMRTQLMKPQLDMRKIKAIHGQIKSLQSQMEDDKLSSILAVRAILTPEQFLEFANLMPKHKPEHEE